MPTRGQKPSVWAPRDVDQARAWGFNPDSPWNASFFSMNSEFYKEIPLGPGRRAIRLLYLEPDPGDGPICCTLEAANLDDNPYFEALSYCWGDATKRKMIVVNGGLIGATHNLHAFLTEIRLKDKRSRLWIDSLCINQSSNEEKTAQVSIMKDIYAAASVTTAYLGDRLPGHAKIKEFLAAHCYVRDLTVKAQSAAQETKPRGFLARSLPKMDRDMMRVDASFDEMRTLRHTLNSPYFSRSWILQELAVSGLVMLQYAQETTRLDNFVTAFKICTSSAEAVNDSALAYGNDREWYERGQALALLHDLDFETTSLPLVYGLSRFRSFKVTWNLDKFYCLFGLAADDVASLGLTPDYDKPAHTLYIEVAYAILTKLQGTAILEVPRGASQLREGLPSWVPDWSDSSVVRSGLGVETQSSRKPFNTSMPADAVDAYDALFQLPDFTSRFRSSGGSRVSVGSLDPDNTLHISVMVFDKIKDMSEELCIKFDGWLVGLRWNIIKAKTMLLEAMQPWSEALRSLDEIVQWRKQASTSRYEPEGDDAFLKTLCANSLPSYLKFVNTTEDFRAMFVRIVTAFEKSSKWYSIGRKTMIGGSEAVKHAGGLASQLNATFNQLSDLFETYMRMIDCMSPAHQRRLAITTKGYLCLVPSETAKNDTIIIAKGGALPLIVRRREEGFTLIGEAYVHGIMNGEAWDESLCEEIAVK